MAADAEIMQGDEANSTLSSSPISSAPVSPHSNGHTSDTIRVLQPFASAQLRGGVTTSSTSATLAAQPQTATSKTAPPADKPKRPRKKKELGPDGAPIEDIKPKVSKPRKPRESKEKTNGTAPIKKKLKLDSEQPTTTSNEKITPLTTTTTNATDTKAYETIPRPVTSGQKYDPIRGMTMDVRPPPPPPPPPLLNSQQPLYVSASPSIASLIDPPINTTTNSSTSSARSPQAVFSSTITHSSPPSQSPVQPRAVIVLDGTMEIDEESPPSKLAVSKTASKVSSTAQTPKLSAARSSPPAKPTGSGLLSSSDLFGGSSASGSERQGVNIDIQIKLNPNGGNHINVAQEIIKKYGRDALNPRAAQHRERLAEVMAAANKIDPGASADDMSIDLMSELGDDSNVEMGGMDNDSEKPRKRRKKVEEYDLDDEFIDDAELAWQQQAAVAMDGFFVYSGPLVPIGETARVETANTVAKPKAPRAKAPRKPVAAAAPAQASLAEKKENAAPSPQVSSVKAKPRPKAPAAPRKRPVKTDKDAEKPKLTSMASTLPVPPPLPVSAAQTPVPSTISISD